MYTSAYGGRERKGKGIAFKPSSLISGDPIELTCNPHMDRVYIMWVKAAHNTCKFMDLL